MSEMVERILARISVTGLVDSEGNVMPDEVRHMIREVIAALRKPSAKMCIAGLLVYKPDAPEDEFATGVMFDAMIDAALADADC
jgi:hypothetical protein